MTKLSFSQVGENERRKLQDAGVRFQWLDRKSETILIENHDLRAMLDVLEADAERSGESPAFEGIVPMKLVARAIVPMPVAVPQRPRHTQTGDPAERAAYVDACSKRMEKETKQSSKAAKKLRKKLLAATSKMFGVWRKEAFSATDAATASVASERRERLLAEFESLKSAPHVQSLRIVGNTLMVKTDVLSATNQKTGDSHMIGQFTILIDLDGKTEMRWFNRDRRINGFARGMNAPNVFADGTGCLSDTTQPMLELTARLELTVVVDLAIQFIENSGEGELGTYINLWPRNYR